VLLGVLLLCWHDMLRNAGALWLFSGAAALLVYGALPPAGRQAVADVLGRDRGARGRNIIERLRKFRATLGTNQGRLHRLNDAAQRLRSLFTWRDPQRTQLFVGCIVLLAIVVAYVPARLLVATAALAAFTRPLRPPGKGATRRAMERFWAGLPVPHASDGVYAADPPPDSVLPQLHMSAGGHSSLG